MHELAFRIVNVFAQNGGRLTGNPLCVFENASSLDTATMQALARQFNLSETTFVLPSSRATAHGADLHAELRDAVRRPSDAGYSARLPRTRTRRRRPEAGNAGGHHSGAGARRPLDAAGERTDLARIRRVARHAGEDAGTRRERHRSRAFVGQGRQRAADRSAHERTRSAQRAPGRRHVRRCPERGRAKHGVCVRRARARAVVVALLLPGRQRGARNTATGSATANLGGWMVATGRKLPCHFDISQGEYAGRPSTLLLDVDGDGRTFVSGDVIELARAARCVCERLAMRNYRRGPHSILHDLPLL